MIELKRIDVKELAQKLSVHENTIYKWLKSGQLPARKIGKLWFREG